MDIPNSDSLKRAYDHWSAVFEGESYYTDAEERDAQILLADEIRYYMEKIDPGKWV